MTNQDVLDKVVAAIGSTVGVRAELEPAAELSGDPLITVRNNPPAKRVSRESDDGSKLTWYRSMTCVLFLNASGSGNKAMRKLMQTPSGKVAALFDNDDGGFDVALDGTATWYAAVTGKLRPGDTLSKDPEKAGSFNWQESWDVVIYVPESAFA